MFQLCFHSNMCTLTFYFCSQGSPYRSPPPGHVWDILVHLALMSTIFFFIFIFYYNYTSSGQTKQNHIYLMQSVYSDFLPVCFSLVVFPTQKREALRCSLPNLSSGTRPSCKSTWVLVPILLSTGLVFTFTLSLCVPSLVAIHMSQPWFHGGLSRKEAQRLIEKQGLVDGWVCLAFLNCNRNLVTPKFLHGCHTLGQNLSY